MPDYGWAYVNLDVLKTIEGPDITGSIAIIKNNTTFSGSKFLAYATASNKVGIGLDFPTVLPAYQLHVSASSGESTAARFVGNVEIDGDLSAEQITSNIVISSSHLTIADSIIGLGFGSGSGETGSLGDRGLVLGLVGGLNQAFLWDQTSGSFVLGKVKNQSPNDTAFDIPHNDLSELHLGQLSASIGVSSSLGEFATLRVQGAPVVSGPDISGTPVQNQVTLWKDADTVEGNAKLTFDGTTLAVQGPISGSDTLQAVSDSIFGGTVKVSGAATFANDLILPAVGDGTGNEVTILVANTLNKREINSGVWDTGKTLVDVDTGGGTPAEGNIAIWGDANSIKRNTNVNYDGTSFAVGTLASSANISGSGQLNIVDETTLGNNLTVSGTVKVGGKIEGAGDTDTFINFTTDDINFQAGGVNFLDLTEDTQNEATFNEGGADVDFRVESVNDTHMLFVDGANDAVSIGVSTDAPSAVLEIAGDAAQGKATLTVVHAEDTNNAVNITADSLTTAKALRISADALTTGNALYIDDDSSSTGTRQTAIVIQNNAAALDATALHVQSDGGKRGIKLDKNYSDTAETSVVGLDIDWDKTGASTTDNTMYGISIDMDNTTATNGNNTMYGLHVTPTLTHAANAGTPIVYGALINAQGGTNGTSLVQGARIEAGGGDINYGIQLDVEDGGVDLRIESSADSGDYFQIQTTTHGATTFTTVDDDAAAAHLTMTVDGDIVLDPAGAVTIADKLVHTGDTDTFLKFDTDKIEFTAGGGELLILKEDTQNIVTVGKSSSDTDFQVITAGNDNTIFVEGSSDKVGIGTGSPEASVSIGSGKHVVTIRQALVKAHNADNTVITEISGFKLPANSVISRVSAVIAEATNLSTYKVSLQISATSGTGADSAISSGTVILGSGASGTRSAGSTGAATDIDMTSTNKDAFINNDLQWVGGSDQYIYVCNAGTGNGTTDASSGKLVIMVEYYGMD